MFGFMLDETETREIAQSTVSCHACPIRLAPRVVVGEATYDRDGYASQAAAWVRLRARPLGSFRAPASPARA